MQALLRRELGALWQSPWQLALASWLPLVSMLALWWLFSAALPRQLPVAWVDLDNSSISRELGRHVAASPVASPSSFGNVNDAVAAMNRAEVYALVVVPAGFSRELMTGAEPTVDVRYNGQFLLVGKLLAANLQLAIADAMKPLAYTKQLASGASPHQAKVNMAPIRTQTTALFNRNNNYVGFLVPPVLIALWQLVAMLVFANALNRELAEPTATPLLKRFAAKFVFYLPLLLAQGLFIHALLFGFLALPLAGSVLWLVPAMVAMLLAVFLMVAFIFLLMQEAARVVSFCTALFAPAFAFMGVTFPVHDMPEAAQYWRLLMPSSHYIDSHIALVSYGVSGAELLVKLLSFAPFLLLLVPIYLLAAKGLRAQDLAQTGNTEHAL
ncbi:ABC transporter permease [Shewanella sp. JM162201]|uniref:ABC transporter permease n=1 Tax=Shewanella jiangmenensis TaxID=2837387 RepID=A0ABS5V2W5_9GAMM|nr:ABC transporter permease [Shewanella jiangmenensis]MBT1443986.1 ABC transporter permease [Shewanella jiangmenensis]